MVWLGGIRVTAPAAVAANVASFNVNRYCCDVALHGE